MGIIKTATGSLPSTSTGYSSFLLTKYLFSSHVPRRSSSELVIFQPSCMFCGKAEAIRVHVSGSWVHQSTSLFEYGDGKTVMEIATCRNDECLLTRIRDQDLFAREARYHPACRKKYTSDPGLYNNTERENNERTLIIKPLWKRHMIWHYIKSSALSLSLS